MGLIIKAANPPSETVALIKSELSSFCERSFEHDGSLILVPLAGKLIEIMRILKKHEITYEFETEKRED